MEQRVNELLPLAAKIAREFGNIPGLPFAEIELSAQEALANAARLFDPEKGDFTPYAAHAMRNALCDLYERQKRHHRHHEYVLDEPVASDSATTAEALVHGIPSPVSPPADHAAIHESRERLEIAMSGLSPRLRVVAEGIRDGKSYSEIGSSLGISKQAAHKLARAAITALREKLESMGFAGLDTLGLLKTSNPSPMSGASPPPSTSSSPGNSPTASIPSATPSTSSSTKTPSPSANVCRGWRKPSPPSSTKPSSATPKPASPMRENCWTRSQSPNHESQSTHDRHLSEL